MTKAELVARQGLPVISIICSTEELQDRVIQCDEYVKGQNAYLQQNGCPVFLVFGTSRPRDVGVAPPESFSDYLGILDGATDGEIHDRVSFLAYSHEEIYDWIREQERSDPSGEKIFRGFRWHGTVAFPCALILGHTTADSAAKAHVQFASASVLLDLAGDGQDLSPADLGLIGASLRVFAMWDKVSAERAMRKRIEESSQQSARAAIMSRNLSHNVGSHVLSNPRLYEVLRFPQLNQQYWQLPAHIARKDVASDPIVDAQNHLVAFHHYVQSRLDFIARSIHQQRERMDPLFLFGDVLQGFFRQRILLETLLSDCGYSAGGDVSHKPITFHVEVRTDAVNGCYEFRKCPGGEFDWAGQSVGRSKSLADPLVGMPAGFVGCQAVYSFLENLMRNAAKYGEHKIVKSLQIHLLIRDATDADCANNEAYYVLEAWDNRGVPASVVRAVRNIRRFLSAGLVDSQGVAVTRGLGIQEMRVAAEFISGNQAFISDDEVRSRMCAGLHAAYVRRRTVASVSDRQALRCYVGKHQFKNQQIHVSEDRFAVSYQLLIPKPRLLGIVPTTRELKAATREKSNPSICWHPSIESLADSGAAFGVVLAPNKPDLNLLSRICKVHNELPYRLVLLVRDCNAADLWKSTIEEAEIKPDQAVGFDDRLPVRRVRVIADEKLYDLMAEASGKEPVCKFVGAEGWNAVMLRCYHLWLKEFKPPPSGVWRVLIAFDRAQDQLSSRWESRLKDFKSNARDGMRIDVRIAEQKTLTPGDGRDEFLGSLNDPDGRDSFIVFDNHGRGAEHLGVPTLHTMPLDFGPAVYHEFGAKSALVLYQTLASPPQEPFSFAYWMYSIIEGALANVLILDERAIESASDDYSTLHQLRVLPVARVKNGGKEECVGPVGANGQAGGCLDVTVPGRMSVTWNYAAVSGQMKGESPGDESPLSPFDAVVIHEGLVDRLVSSGMWIQNATNGAGIEHNLFALAPRVIRTSGRGAAQRSLDKRLPFLEASELVATLYQAKNKPSLGKAILSVAGRVSSEE